MDKSNVQSLERAFLILERLSTSRSAMGPTEISALTGIHKSTVYRILVTLQSMGYVEKDDNGVYRVGVKLVEMVSNHINNLELQTEARPYLNELHLESQLVVHLGILDGKDVVYIEKMDIVPNLRLYSQIGIRVPAYCSSLGKCLLATLSGDRLDYIFSKVKMEAFTDKTIVNIKDLKNHLRKVRSQGWAMDDEEYIVGHRCIGAPVYDYRGECIAAVSASGPISILDETRIDSVSEKVRLTAGKISKRLMYSG